MAVTISGTDGIVGAGFTVDASGVSVTAGVGTFSSLNAAASGLTGALPALDAANLTSINAAQLVGVCTSGLTKTGGFGKFASYAIICDQKATDTPGGSTTTGTFNTRDLNTELADPDGIVSISSNQFTLQAGTYVLKASAPAYKAQRHQILINNVTDSSVAVVGTSEYNDNSTGIQTRSFAVGRVTIAAAKAFDIRQRVAVAEATYGLGVEANYDLQPNIYTIVEIFKEA